MVQVALPVGHYPYFPQKEGSTIHVPVKLVGAMQQSRTTLSPELSSKQQAVRLTIGFLSKQKGGRQASARFGLYFLKLKGRLLQ